MKLRMLGNSVRLRVTRSEFERVVAGEQVIERVGFPGDIEFEYALVVAHVPAIEARFDGGRVEIVLPPALAEGWRDPERVGIYGSVGIGSGRQLDIAVEKDYRCVGPVDEDQSDMFPNPAAPESC